MHTDITWTDTAWERWREAVDHCHSLAAYFGPSLSNDHLAELLLTFQRVTFAAGPVNVQRDGDGFYITTPHIVIGLVWTPDSDEAMRKRIVSREPWFGTIPADWPRTGRWSAHS